MEKKNKNKNNDDGMSCKDDVVNALVDDYFDGGIDNGKVINIKTSSEGTIGKNEYSNRTYKYQDAKSGDVRLLTYEDIIDIIEDCIDERGI